MWKVVWRVLLVIVVLLLALWALCISSARKPAMGAVFDSDCDGDVDYSDTRSFIECLAGPSVTVGSVCDIHDADGNGFVDLADISTFQSHFTGDFVEEMPRITPCDENCPPRTEFTWRKYEVISGCRPAGIEICIADAGEAPDTCWSEPYFRIWQHHGGSCQIQVAHLGFGSCGGTAQMFVRVPNTVEIYHAALRMFLASDDTTEAAQYLLDRPWLARDMDGLLDFLLVDSVEPSTSVLAASGSAIEATAGDDCHDVYKSCPDRSGGCSGGGIAPGDRWDHYSIVGLKIGSAQLEVVWDRQGGRDPDTPIANCCCPSFITGLTVAGSIPLGTLRAAQVGNLYTSGCVMDGGTCEEMTTKALKCLCCYGPHVVLSWARQCMAAVYSFEQRIGIDRFAVTLHSFRAPSEIVCSACMDGASPP